MIIIGRIKLRNMQKIKDFLYFYRVMNWENKISGVRPIAYTFFGYAMAGKFELMPIVLNSIAIFATLVLCYAINDFYDWKFQGERNFLASLMQQKRMSEKRALFFTFLPLIFFPLVWLVASPLSLGFFAAQFLFILFYSAPPLRLKDKKFWGFVAPPLAVTSLFLQGFTLLGKMQTPDIIFLAVVVFLFQCYLEMLHVIDDSLVKEEIKKISDTEKAIGWLKKIPLLSGALSLVFAYFNPLFLITTFFSTIRYFFIAKFEMSDIRRIRKNFFLPQWSAYEFLIYGALGALQIFR
jgi:hypothetical protein